MATALIPAPETKTTEPILDSQQTTCCIVGGGPGGMMLALLLARKGVRVTVLGILGKTVLAHNPKVCGFVPTLLLIRTRNLRLGFVACDRRKEILSGEAQS